MIFIAKSTRLLIPTKTVEVLLEDKIALNVFHFPQYSLNHFCDNIINDFEGLHFFSQGNYLASQLRFLLKQGKYIAGNKYLVKEDSIPFINLFSAVVFPFKDIADPFCVYLHVRDSNVFSNSELPIHKDNDSSTDFKIIIHISNESTATTIYRTGQISKSILYPAGIHAVVVVGKNL